MAISGGPWAAELLNGGHQTLIQGSLVGSGGSLYAYTDGYLVRLDPVTGSVLARTPFSPAVPNPPVIVGNTAWTVLGYSGGGNVTLRAFDATTHRRGQDRAGTRLRPGVVQRSRGAGQRATTATCMWPRAAVSR